MRRTVGAKSFLKKLYASWNEDALGDTAAALTYYAVLALFPFLLFLVTLTGLVLDPARVNELVDQLSAVAPAAATQIIAARLQSLEQSRTSGLFAVLGLVGALWAASGAVTSLTRALNRCYDVRETRPFWKTRALAIVITVVAGVFSILAALVMFAVPALAAHLGGALGRVAGWLRFPIAALLVATLWAILFRVLPNVKPKFQLISPGSLVGVVLWLLASWAFSEYVRHFSSYEKSYGALGGVIVLLVWMWMSSVVVLLGAEINRILTPAEKIHRESPTSEPRQAELRPPHPEPEPTPP